MKNSGSNWPYVLDLMRKFLAKILYSINELQSLVTTKDKELNELKSHIANLEKLMKNSNRPTDHHQNGFEMSDLEKH